MDVAYQLDVEWPHLAAGKVARALPCWQHSQPELRPFSSPRRLLAYLHTAPAEQTNGPLLALLSLARRERILGKRQRRLGVDPCEALAARILLQVMLAPLKARADRIVHPAHLRDEVWELMLFSAWEAICCYPLRRRRRRVAANLVLLVVHHTTRALARESLVQELAERNRALLGECALAEGALCDDAALESLVAPHPPVPPETVVVAAVALGLICAADADLVLYTRVDGVPLTELARAHAVDYGTLLKRRQRAEAVLRSLLDSDVDVRTAAVSDPVSYEGAISLSQRRRRRRVLITAARAIAPPALRAA